MAFICAPFAGVVAAICWVQDKVAGGQCPWQAMRGAAPDLTGGLSSEAFVRKQRDEWDSTPPAVNESLTTAPVAEDSSVVANQTPTAPVPPPADWKWWEEGYRSWQGSAPRLWEDFWIESVRLTDGDHLIRHARYFQNIPYYNIANVVWRPVEPPTKKEPTDD